MTEQDIIQTEMTQEQFQQKIDCVELKRHEAQLKLEDLNSKMHNEINVIRGKYDVTLNQFRESVKLMDEEIRVLKEEKRKDERESNWKEALVRGEINEFYLGSLMIYLGIKESLTCDFDILHKGDLQNGITVWMMKNDGRKPWKIYLAFHEEFLVGVSYRETARHAGDETSPYSFIGGFDVEDLIVVTENGKFRDFKKNATFRNWMAELKKVKTPQAYQMPMNKETLNELRNGMTDYWNYYGWTDRVRERFR